MAFCTELNNVCARHSADAPKDTIESKLKLFKEAKFIQSFPVVILACGSYIVNQGNNRQIDDTFGVTFRKTGLPDADQKYWIHYDGQVSESPRKLVIRKIGKSYVRHLFCQCFFVTLRCISSYSI